MGDQAGAKKRRYLARQAKAKKVAPRPTGGDLRPVVRCPTFKYNTKQRLGRGFTLDELKAAGIATRYARSIGIAVDARRRNKDSDALMPVVKSAVAVEPRAITADEKKAHVYREMRQARGIAKSAGKQQKKADEKKADEK